MERPRRKRPPRGAYAEAPLDEDRTEDADKDFFEDSYDEQSCEDDDLFVVDEDFVAVDRCAPNNRLNKSCYFIVSMLQLFVSQTRPHCEQFSQ